MRFITIVLLGEKLQWRIYIYLDILDARCHCSLYHLASVLLFMILIISYLIMFTSDNIVNTYKQNNSLDVCRSVLSVMATKYVVLCKYENHANCLKIINCRNVQIFALHKNRFTIFKHIFTQT